MALATVENSLKKVKDFFNPPEIITPIQRVAAENKEKMIYDLRSETRREFADLIVGGNNQFGQLLGRTGIVEGKLTDYVPISGFLTDLSGNMIDQIADGGNLTHNLVEASKFLVEIIKEPDLAMRTRLSILMCESILEKNRKTKVGMVSKQIPILFGPWEAMMQRIVDQKPAIYKQLRQSIKDNKKAEDILLKIGEHISERGDVFTSLADQYNQTLNKMTPIDTLNEQAKFLAMSVNGSLVTKQKINPGDIKSFSDNRKKMGEHAKDAVDLGRLTLKVQNELSRSQIDGLAVGTQETTLDASIWGLAAAQFGTTVVCLTALAGMAQGLEIASLLNMYYATQLISLQRGSRQNVVLSLDRLKGKIAEGRGKIDQFGGTLSGPYTNLKN